MRVCVTGSTGYIGSALVRSLLQRGYHVHATARDTDKASQLLLPLDGDGRLRIFQADLNEDGSFDEALQGCVGLFHVAASMVFNVSTEENIEEYARSNVLETVLQGNLNVLRACLRAGTIKRIVFTSSISTITSIDSEGNRKMLVDESCLVPLEQVWKIKPTGWIYILAKRLTEEEAFKFAEQNNINLVSIVPCTVAGPFLTQNVPSSVQVLLSPITGDRLFYSILASVYRRFGSLPLVHIEDVCNAHIFLMEELSSQGRYLCVRGNYSIREIVELLSAQHPFHSERVLEEFSAAAISSVASSRRLTDLGFRFKHDEADIVNQTIACCAEHGALKQ